MFGGLSVKDHKEETAPVEQSGFSFLNAAAQAPATTTTTTSTSTSTSTDPVDCIGSGFDFLVQQQPAVTAPYATTGSGFSFLSNNEASNAPEPTTTTAMNTTGTTTSFSFLSNLPKLSEDESAALDLLVKPTIPTSECNLDANSEVSDISEVTAKPGISFEGAVLPKKTIAKKRRAKKIGLGAAAVPSPTNAVSLPEPQKTNVTTTHEPPPPPEPESDVVSSAHLAAERAELFMKEKMAAASASSESPPPMQGRYKDEVDATVQAAERAAKEAQELMQHNGSTNTTNSGGLLSNFFGRKNTGSVFGRKSSPTTIPTPPRNRVKITPASLDTPAMMAAAAQRPTLQVDDDLKSPDVSTPTVEISRQVHPQDPAPTISTASNGLTSGSVSGSSGFSFIQPNTFTSTSSSWQPSSPSFKIPIYAPPKDEPDQDEARRRSLFKEQERQYEEQQRLRREEDVRLSAEQERTRLELMRSPSQKLDAMLESFKQVTSAKLSTVSRWRVQRSKLMGEQLKAQQQLALLEQQVETTEQQQTLAAQDEDYELADRLTEVLAQQDSQRRECRQVLHTLEQALDELQSQRQVAVSDIVACFTDIRLQLSSFQKDQSTKGKEGDSESMVKFELVSKKISAEQDRLAIENEHLSKDEELVSAERLDLEATIHEETKITEEKRSKSIAELELVSEEIEKLKQLLAQKQAEAANLQANIATHDGEIVKVRNKFSRQLTRISKKELALKENRAEWESDNKALSMLKEDHEKEMQARAEELLKFDTMLARITEELGVAEKLECLVADELNLGKSCQYASVEDEELAKELARCQAAVDEAKVELNAAVSALDALEAEMREIDDTLPILEEEKKRSVSKRDFKGAGRASKTIKEMQTRREMVVQEIISTATERVTKSTDRLNDCMDALNKQYAAYKAVEGKVAHIRMLALAEQIHMLEQMKQGVCSGSTNHVVAAMGAAVLDDEIQALTLEGEKLDAEFGGWDECLAKFTAEHFSTRLNQTPPRPTKNQSQVDLTEVATIDFPSEIPLDEPKKITSDIIESFQALEQRLKDAEASLEEAVENEDYDQAAELDHVIQTVLDEMHALGYTREEILKAVNETEEEEGDAAENGESNNEDTKNVQNEEEEESTKDSEKENHASNGEDENKRFSELDHDEASF